MKATPENSNNCPTDRKQPPLITADIPVMEVVQRWPETISVFLKYHTACVGCSMAVFETLGSAARIYHLPLQQFLIDLEQAANIRWTENSDSNTSASSSPGEISS